MGNKPRQRAHKKKGFRDGIDKKAIMANMTDATWARLKEEQLFNDIEPGTWTWKIAVHCCAIRKVHRKYRSDLQRKLWTVRNIEQLMKRLQHQIDTGNITETLKDNTMMDENELILSIAHHKWTQQAEVQNVPEILAEIRKIVGNYDVTGKSVVISGEDFEVLSSETFHELKEIGYDVLAEVETTQND